MEMVETWWNTCHSSCLTMGNHIPVTFPPYIWCGLHIPCHTSILGQKGGFTGQKEPILRPKKYGNGRNMMKYISFIMSDPKESDTSHISTWFLMWASYSISHFDFRPKRGYTGQNKSILRPKTYGNGRNMTKYRSFIMSDPKESYTSHIFHLISDVGFIFHVTPRF